jgi:hypothetical protein
MRPGRPWPLDLQALYLPLHPQIHSADLKPGRSKIPIDFLTPSKEAALAVTAHHPKRCSTTNAAYCGAQEGAVCIAANSFASGKVRSMKAVVALALWLLASLSIAQVQWHPAEGYKQIPIWPGAIPDARPTKGPETLCAYPQSPIALEDAQRTISLLRSHAGEYKIDPHKIGELRLHPFGLRPTKYPATYWPHLVEIWLRTINVLPPA